MLMPKKVKYRKQQRGRMAGKAWTGGTLAFGDYGLKALECGWVTAREIEAGRIAITRFIKRNGRIWIRMLQALRNIWDIPDLRKRVLAAHRLSLGEICDGIETEEHELLSAAGIDGGMRAPAARDRKSVG